MSPTAAPSGLIARAGEPQSFVAPDAVQSSDVFGDPQPDAFAAGLLPAFASLLQVMSDGSSSPLGTPDASKADWNRFSLPVIAPTNVTQGALPLHLSITAVEPQETVNADEHPLARVEPGVTGEPADVVVTSNPRGKIGPSIPTGSLRNIPILAPASRDALEQKSIPAATTRVDAPPAKPQEVPIDRPDPSLLGIQDAKQPQETSLAPLPALPKTTRPAAPALSMQPAGTAPATTNVNALQTGSQLNATIDIATVPEQTATPIFSHTSPRALNAASSNSVGRDTRLKQPKNNQAELPQASSSTPPSQTPVTPAAVLPQGNADRNAGDAIPSESKGPTASVTASNPPTPLKLPAIVAQSELPTASQESATVQGSTAPSAVPSRPRQDGTKSVDTGAVEPVARPKTGQQPAISMLSAADRTAAPQMTRAAESPASNRDSAAPATPLSQPNRTQQPPARAQESQPQSAQTDATPVPATTAASPNSGELAFAVKVTPQNDNRTVDAGEETKPQVMPSAFPMAPLKEARHSDNDGTAADSTPQRDAPHAAPLPAGLVPVAEKPAALGQSSMPEAHAATPLHASQETMAVAETPEVKTSEPLKQLSIQIGQAPQQKVEVRVVERAGELQVAVRTANPDLAQGLRQGISDLVGQLQQSGFHADAWRPNTPAGPTPVAAADKPQTQAGSQNNNSQHSSGGQQDRQQGNHNPSRRPQWVEELETTTQGGTHSIPGENYGISR